MNRLTLTLFIVVAAASIGSCGTTRRTPVEGYSDADLNGRRVFVLTQSDADLQFTDAAQFASLRGVASASAQEVAANELATVLGVELQLLLDSNTVLPYLAQPVAGLVPLDATRDFQGGAPRSWEDLKRAGREANIDYLLVVNSVRINSSSAREGADAFFGLFDLANGRVMRSGPVSATGDAQPGTSVFSLELARELASRLPFWVGE